MAEVTNVRTLDDLFQADGKDVDGAAEVLFGLDGKQFTVDLVGENADLLREALAPFIAVARLYRPAAAAARRAKAPGDNSRTRVDRSGAKAKRAWARARGMNVSERGRIPAEVEDAYNQAHAHQVQG